MTGTVTFATNNGDIAGGEVMLFAMAEAARSLGCPVTVVAPSSPSAVLQLATDKGFRVVEIIASTRSRYMRRLRAWDARFRTGVLWCNGLVPAFATSGHADRVVHLHQDPLGPLQAAYYRRARLGALRVYVPSHTMAVRLPGSVALPNWNEQVHPTGLRHDTTGQGLALGFLGRHSPLKGLDVLADALRLLDEREPGRFRLILAGDSRSVPEVDVRRVERALAPVDHLIQHEGWLSRDEFFGAIDLAVFPSVWQEPFGLVASEAMSAEVPFVVSDAGAFPEIVGPRFPWIARAGDSEALAAVILRASRDQGKAAVADSFARWQQEYSPEAGMRRMATALAATGILGSARP